MERSFKARPKKRSGSSERRWSGFKMLTLMVVSPSKTAMITKRWENRSYVLGFKSALREKL